MNKWLSYTAEEVLKGTDDTGNRLVILFVKDYKSVFNISICHTCKDFKTKYQKFIQKISTMKENKSGFVLKKMYNNILLGFGKRIYVNNENMTDEYGKTLLENHPRGKDLFSSIPNNLGIEDLPEDIKTLVDNNTKKELAKMAEDLGLEISGNKIELAKAISETEDEYTE